MTTLTATTLSEETIASTKASLAALDALQATIMSSAQTNDAINNDDGVQTLYNYVVGVRSKFTDPDESDAQEVMPAPVVELLSNVIVPGLADVVGELQELWTNILAAVTNGNQGEPLTQEYLTASEDDDSALMRVQTGLEQLQELSLQDVAETVSDGFGELFSAFSEVFGQADEIDAPTNQRTEPKPATADDIANAKAFLDAGTITQSEYDRIAGVPIVTITRAESAAQLLQAGSISQAEHDQLVASA